jgi:hypothetical protein
MLILTVGIAILTRGNDVEAEEDGPVTDKQAVEVKVRERYLLPRLPRN